MAIEFIQQHLGVRMQSRLLRVRQRMRALNQCMFMLLTRKVVRRSTELPVPGF